MRGRDLILKTGGFKLSLTAQVQALFAGGRVGGMWDMGDTSTLFQDTAGATPVTAVTQPIGIVLDKSQGLVLGSERVTNGDFSGGTTGWTAIGATIGAGVCQFSVGGGVQELVQSALTIGKNFVLQFTVSNFVTAGNLRIRLGNESLDILPGITGNGTYSCYVVAAADAEVHFVNYGTSSLAIAAISAKEIPGNHATQPTAGSRPLYQVVSSYGCAQFDATDDALLFPAIAFGGAFNTFVAGKLTGGTNGVHIWRTVDFAGGYWGVYQSGSATSPTGGTAGSPTYYNNGIAVSPQTREQIYTLINGVDSVLESIGVVLSAETALQFSGYGSSFNFQGNAHRVLMISGTLTAAEKLLCRQWAAEGNGVTVV